MFKIIVWKPIFGTGAPSSRKSFFRHYSAIDFSIQTRMHSSRMRTVRSSSHVYPSMHWGCASQQSLGRGVVCPGGCLPRGVSAYWGYLPIGGVCPEGVCIPACTGADTPLWTEWQTGVKQLPCRNYVADGNKLAHNKLDPCDFFETSSNWSRADPRRGARDVRLQSWSKFFHFHAVFSKNFTK